MTLQLRRFLPCGVENNIVHQCFSRYCIEVLNSRMKTTLHSGATYNAAKNMMSVCLIVKKKKGSIIKDGSRISAEVSHWWIVPSPETKTSSDQSVWQHVWRDIWSPVCNVTPAATFNWNYWNHNTWIWNMTSCLLSFRASPHIKRLLYTSAVMTFCLNSPTPRGVKKKKKKIIAKRTFDTRLPGNSIR